MNGLDERGEVKVDAYDDLYTRYEEDTEYHAPTEFMYAQREERQRRRLRDLNELQDLWREEVQARRRENAGRHYRGTHV